MKNWYKAVCDTCKEFCDVMVDNPACTQAYLGDKGIAITRWLSKHWSCDLRLVHRDEQLDPLWDTHTRVVLQNDDESDRDYKKRLKHHWTQNNK